MINTTQDKLNYLNETKTQIMNALKAMGVEVPTNATFRDAVRLIKTIEGGGQVKLFNSIEKMLEMGGVKDNIALVYNEETSTLFGLYEHDGESWNLLSTQLTATGSKIAPGYVGYGANGVEEGSYTSDADATSMDMLYPKTAYVNGHKIQGSMRATYIDLANIEVSSSEDIDEYTKYVGNNYFVKTSATYIKVLKLENNKLQVLNTFNFAGNLSSYNSSSHTRGDCSIYSADNNDIRFIIPAAAGSGTIYYIRFDANDNSIRLINSYTLASPMYSTSVWARFPNHSNNRFVHWTEQVSYNGIDRQVMAMFSLTNTSISLKQVFYNERRYGNNAWNVHFANNDKLFCMTRTTATDSSNSARQHWYVLNDNFDIVTSKVDTEYDLKDLVISDNGKYAYMYDNIYEIQYESNGLISNRTWKRTMHYTPNGLFGGDYLMGSKDGVNYISKIYADFTPEDIIVTNDMLIQNRTKLGVFQRSNNTYGWLIENLDYLGEKTINELKINNDSYFRTTDIFTGENQVLQDVVFINNTGKHTGKVPNKGSLVVDPLETSQSFPAGFYNSITVNADTFENHSEYNECLALTAEILS